MSARFVAALLLLSALANAEPAPPCSLTIQVRVPESGGAVRLALFDSEESWLGESFRSARLPLKGRSATWRIPGLPCGRYGFALYHDANDNGRLDRRFLGLPGEPYAFSNDRRVGFGPPDWDDSAFTVDGRTFRRAHAR